MIIIHIMNDNTMGLLSQINNGKSQEKITRRRNKCEVDKSKKGKTSKKGEQRRQRGN